MDIFSGGMKSRSRTVAHCSSGGLVSGIAMLSHRGCCLDECLVESISPVEALDIKLKL